MQNQEFSEEYYKMKYFKYRAKYEQLKEIAEARGQQTGGMDSVKGFFGYGPKAAPVPASNQPIVQVPVDQMQPTQSKPSITQQVTQAYSNYSASQQQKKADNATAIDQLMREVNIFIKENTIGIKDNEHNKKKYYKILGKLEEPCSYKQLIEIVNSIEINEEEEINGKFKTIKEVKQHTSEFDNKKAGLIQQINKQCATVTGGINALCKYNDDPQQRGGYIDSPNSLDELTISLGF
jgi:hypothetical protein